MKLIKTMLVGMFVFSMILAQQPQTGGQTPPPGGNPGGPPPSGTPGGPPPGENPGGPPPSGTPGGPPQSGAPGGDYQGDYDGNDQGPTFEDVDTDGDGLISREEARAVYGKDDEGNDDPNFDDRYNEVDANGDGMVDPNEHMMAESRDDEGDHDGDDYGNDHDGNDHDGNDYGNDHDGNDHDGGDHGPMDGPMGPNFDEANCMALEHNSPVFWVDHNQNGEKDTVTMDDVAGTDYEGEPWKSPDYEGPYGTYHEYEDGSPVDCGGNHQGGNHQGGDHQGGPGGPGGPDAPSQAVVDAWMSGAQQDGGFNFDAAFNAAEAQAKAEAQAEGEYFGDDAWNECADAGRAAMQEARDDNKSPQEVFQYVGQAVNACGEAQAAANQD
ncbi:MAG: hypothetical protein VX746_01875 [Candidatus Neomarinimicrobiota bacterium]|nr:hypothetical protein [Candidatus Neomarinimicrobiota bacterium]